MNTLGNADTSRFSRFSSDAYTIGGATKRLFDVTFATLAIVVLAPLILVLTGLIKSSSTGPALYCHRRVGLNGREFGCLKFRTMHVDGDAILAKFLSQNPDAAREYAETAKLRKDPRVIRGIGTLLRKTSLDELPQFYNVLVGQMSVIGPRPVTRAEMDRFYGPRAHVVLAARPGISGLWQVSGRSGLSYADRVRLDLFYVRHWGFLNDMRILARTIVVVLFGRGAY